MTVKCSWQQGNSSPSLPSLRPRTLPAPTRTPRLRGAARGMRRIPQSTRDSRMRVHRQHLCGSATGQCGSATGQCGSATGQCGSATGQCGSATGQCGSATGHVGVIKPAFFSSDCRSQVLIGDMGPAAAAGGFGPAAAAGGFGPTAAATGFGPAAVAGGFEPAAAGV